MFEGIPQYKVLKSELQAGLDAATLLAEKTAVFASKGETKKLIQGGGVSVNKEKVLDANQLFTTAHLINEQFIVVQKGKKNYFLLIAE